MIEITEKALLEIKKEMEEKNLKGYGLRLAIVGGSLSGFEYTISFSEKPSESDLVFDFNDIKVFIDPTSYDYLKEIKLDYEEGENQSGFKFINKKSYSLSERE